jgi:hypothetical protein
LKLQETIVYESCHNNLDLISEVVPDILIDPELICIYRYVRQSKKADERVTFASVKTKIQQDKKQGFKGDLLERLETIENGVYGYTEHTFQSVVGAYKSTLIDISVQTYQKIKKDATYADIEKFADDIKLVNAYGMQIHDTVNAETAKTDFINTPIERLTDERLYLPKSNEQATFMRMLFGDYFRPRQYVLGGYPSMGKNILLYNLIVLMIKQGHKGVYFNWDNTINEEVSSILSTYTGIPYRDIEDRTLTQEDSTKIKDVNLGLVDFSPKIKNWKEVKRVLETGNYKWYAIDYFDKMKYDVKQGKTQGLEENASELQNMCRDFNITGIILSQLNKDGGMKWCSSLFENAFYALKIDGVRGTSKRKISNHKFKRGVPMDYTMHFRGDNGTILSIQEGWDE